MDVIVCVKQVLDTRLPIEVTKQGVIRQREDSPVYVFNPADRCALEVAIRLREVDANCRITAITVGPLRAEAVLASCLARGVDWAVHLLTDEPVQLDSFSVAHALSAEIRTRGFDLILCGNRTEDGGASEVGPVLAELLDIAQVTGVVKLDVSPASKRIAAERKLERGYRQLVEAGLPALVAVDGSISHPRYVTRRASRYWLKTLAQKSSLIPVREANSLSYGPSLRRLVGNSPPRPRPKKIAQPDAGMSPEERIAMLMGGALPNKPGQRRTGPAESLADEIIGFLRERGLLG